MSDFDDALSAGLDRAWLRRTREGREVEVARGAADDLDSRIRSVILATLADMGMAPALSDALLWAIPGAETGPAVDVRGYLYARTPISQGEPVLSDVYREVIVASDDGVPLIAIGRDGQLLMADRAFALSELAHAQVSDDGRVLIGWTLDGEPHLGPLPGADWRVEVRGDPGAQHVYLCAPGLPELRVTATAGTYRGALIRGAWLSYIDLSSGIGQLRRVALGGASPMAAGVQQVQHVISSGQSLSVGTSATPAVTTAAPLPGRLRMFSAGVTATGTSQSGSFEGEVISDADVAGLVDAVSGTNEVPVLGAGRWLAGADAARGVIVSAHGIGGQPYSDLKRGTVPYANILRAVVRGAYLTRAAGLAYDVPALIWTQGEADRLVDQATYLGWMEELQADITTDLRDIIGGTGPVRLLVDQISNWTSYGAVASDVPLAQLQAAIDNPGLIYCCGPKYMLPTTDGVHLTAAASANLGARQGRALRQILDGATAINLRAVSAVRSGAVVTLTFALPVGGAGIDLHTGLVSDPGSYGLDWLDDGSGNAVTISSVAVASATALTVTLSAVPTGGAQRIGIAARGLAAADGGPTTGPRSCIRSASADTDPFGGAMDHYACHQIITIT